MQPDGSSGRISTINDKGTYTRIPQSESVIPTCEMFVASPQSIALGDSTTLMWETADAEEVSISNGIGEVSLDGAIVVSPTESTSYTLVAEGKDGSYESCTVQVNVLKAPSEGGKG